MKRLLSKLHQQNMKLKYFQLMIDKMLFYQKLKILSLLKIEFFLIFCDFINASSPMILIEK